MESASSVRQSLRTTSLKLPEELSASSDVGVTRVAMMGDQSQCKAREGSVKPFVQAATAKAVRSILWRCLGAGLP